MAAPGLPPAYEGSTSSAPGPLSAPSTSGQDELPVYEGRRPSPLPHSVASSYQEPKEFSYELMRKDKPWAVFTINANPRLSANIPTFLEGYPIAGSVKLNLGGEDLIQAVTITARGQIVTGANPGEQFTFLEHTITVWSQSMGDPRSDATSSTAEQFTGKLQGSYVWPYSFKLPNEIVLPTGPRNEPQIFRLPQTFLERHTRGSVQYHLLLRFCRKKLRVDHKMETSFGYIPITKPDPPSFLRQLAYQENSLLLGPDGDPDGWYCCPNVKIQGQIFNDRTVNVDCSLFLAKPLGYTRGSVIPMIMVLETKDFQALDLLSVPRGITVRLRRVVKYHLGVGKTVDTIAWKDTIDHSHLAVWWPSTEGAMDIPSCRRSINGELHLKADMIPTSAMARFRVEYYIVLFPFDAPAFSAADAEPLIVEPVEIATSYNSGPRPRRYSPPGYERTVDSVKDKRLYLEMPSSGFL